MQKITKNVYVEGKTSLCNSSCVVTKEGVVAIDTPNVPANARQHVAAISKFSKIQYVINTEPHGDHFSGNCYFGGTLIAHAGTRDAILASKVEDFENMFKMMNPDALPLGKDFRFRAPDITLTDRLTIYLGDHTFQLINMPGHTPYQVAVYVPEERVIFTSDNISRTLPYFFQALPDEWLKTLKNLQKFDVDYVVPGHGDVGDKSIISEMYDNLNIWINTVKDAIKKGMTLKEVQSKVTMAKELPNLPRDEHSADVIKMNVTKIFEFLKK
jgi:cyclase